MTTTIDAASQRGNVTPATRTTSDLVSLMMSKGIYTETQVDRVRAALERADQTAVAGTKGN